MTRLTYNFQTLNLSDNAAFVQGSGGNHLSPDYMDTSFASGGGSILWDLASKTWETASTTAGGVAQMRRSTGISTALLSTEGEMAGRPHPTGSIRLCELRNASDTAAIARLTLQTDGTVQLLDAAGTSKWSSASAVPTSAGWRWYLGVEKGTGATDGELHVALYLTDDGKGATAAAGNFYDASNVDAGTTDVVAARYGFTSGGPGQLAWRNIQIETESFAPLGPLGSAPVIGTSVSIVGDYFNDITSTSPPVTIYSATQISGTSVGSIILDGIAAYFAKPTVDAATIRYVLRDAANREAIVEKTHSLSGTTVSKVRRHAGGGVWVA